MRYKIVRIKFKFMDKLRLSRIIKKINYKDTHRNLSLLVDSFNSGNLVKIFEDEYKMKEVEMLEITIEEYKFFEYCDYKIRQLLSKIKEKK